VELFIILGGLALALPLMVLAAANNQRRITPEVERPRVYAAVASRLKLQRSETDVKGRIGDQAVRAHAAIGVSGSRTIARCEISPPLDLGLLLETHDLPEGELAHENIAVRRVESGDGALDDRFVLMADDPRRARRLLDRQLREHLLAAVQAARVIVTDDRIELQVSGLPDDRYLVWALEAVAGLGEALALSRRNVPSDRSLLPLSPGYRREAKEHGFTFARTPLGLRASIDGFDVFVGARRTGQQTYEGVALARFPGSLGLGLSVRGTSVPGRDLESGNVDYLVGDALFDRVFVVAGDEPLPTLEVLTAELRGLLLAAADSGVVTLTDQLVEVRLAVVPPPSSVKRWMETVTKLAELACAGLRGDTLQRGPYR
jgi:hypothetical protein